jgi:outer membrane lipoprotein carrier protein
MPRRNTPLMKRLALCITLLLLSSPSVALGTQEDLAEPHDAPPLRTENEESPTQQTALLDRILQQMDIAYKELQSYRAEFDQESETKAFKRKRQSSGRLCFLKPSEMRWSYLEPENREVYLSGEQIRIYIPSRNQVLEQTLNDAMPGMAPARLFMGVRELGESFVIGLADTDAEDEKAYCLRLTPKKMGTSSVEEILLWVGHKDFLPLRTESRDVLGNRTTLLFRNAEVNVPLKEDLFHFEIPPDAEVMGNPF